MDEKRLGNINVDMGDGNIVGDIGHKIIYEAPPPSRNAIWQDGRVVGEIGSAPVAGQGTYTFEKLFVEESFDENRCFEIQGIKLKIEKSDSIGSVSLAGRPSIRTFWHALCQILG